MQEKLRPTTGVPGPTGHAESASRPLRIALLGYRSQPHGGGQGVYLRYLSKALVEAGHTVDVISGPPYPHLDPRVRLIQLPSMDLFVNGLGSLRLHHLKSMSNIIEWTSQLTGGFAEPLTFGRVVSARGTLAGLTRGRGRAIGYVTERETFRVARFTGTDTVLGGLFRERPARRLLDVAFEERRAVHVACDLEGFDTDTGSLEVAAYNDAGTLLGMVPLSTRADRCRVGAVAAGRYAVMWSDTRAGLDVPRSIALHTTVLDAR